MQEQISGTYDFCYLFLDKLPEFGKNLIEVLRQPLEGHPREVSISRASGTITFPANFMLVATQKPCLCGYYGDHTPPYILIAKPVVRGTRITVELILAELVAGETVEQLI